MHIVCIGYIDILCIDCQVSISLMPPLSFIGCSCTAAGPGGANTPPRGGRGLRRAGRRMHRPAAMGSRHASSSYSRAQSGAQPAYEPRILPCESDGRMAMRGGRSAGAGAGGRCELVGTSPWRRLRGVDQDDMAHAVAHALAARTDGAQHVLTTSPAELATLSDEIVISAAVGISIPCRKRSYPQEPTNAAVGGKHGGRRPHRLSAGAQEVRNEQDRSSGRDRSSEDSAGAPRQCRWQHPRHRSSGGGAAGRSAEAGVTQSRLWRYDVVRGDFDGDGLDDTAASLEHLRSDLRWWDLVSDLRPQPNVTEGHAVPPAAHRGVCMLTPVHEPNFGCVFSC